MRRSALSLLLLLGCTNLAKQDRPPEEGSIRIGILSNLVIPDVNVPRVQAAELAAKEINDAGGIFGRRLEILANGDRTDSVSGMEGARTLIRQGCVAMVAGPNSAVTVTVYPVTSAAGVPIMAPSASAPSLSNLAGAGTTFWRTAPSDVYQSRVLADKVYASGLRQVGVVYRNDAFGSGLATAFRDAFATLGGTTTVMVNYPTNKTSGFGTEVAALFAPGVPQGVLMVSLSVDGAALSREIQAYNPQPLPRFFGVDSLFNPDFLANAAPAIREGMFGTAPALPEDPNFRLFAERYQAHTGQFPMNNTVGATYDAVYLFAYAMVKGGAPTSQAIIANLREVSGGYRPSPSPLVYVNQWARGRDLILAGGSVNYEGASGKVDFDARGDVTSGVYAWWTIRNGAFVQVELVPFTVP